MSALRLLYIALYFITQLYAADIHIQIYTNESFPIILDENFLSIALGGGVVKHHYETIDFNSEKLLTLCKGLKSTTDNPYIYFRVMGERAIFNATEFENLYRFVNQLNWRLIYELNLFPRNPDGSWDSTNAESLINFVTKKGYVVDYELGNEPDLYPTHRNITIPPEQLANDFLTLRKLLLKKTTNSQIFGPDDASISRYNYFENILSNMEDGVLNAVTFHQYYSSSINITISNFTSPAYLDTLILKLQKAFQIVNRSITKFPRPPVWIGETSSTYLGGRGTVLGMTYVAGFLWLDKLGVSAQMNISVVIRQNIRGKHYSLLNNDYTPSNDYWISFLYKQLVGRTVLNLTDSLVLDKEVRVYAHCINPYGEMGYPPYSIVLMVLNLDKHQTATLFIKNRSLHWLDVDQFLFSPLHGNLNDTETALNGVRLKMVNDTTLPELKPLRIKQPIRIPPLRYGFYVLLGSRAEICMS